MNGPPEQAIEKRRTVSVVTPAYNEAGNLEAIYRRLVSAVAAAGTDFEWIVVDDHSADGTFEILQGLARRDGRVRGLRLARNSGSHAAIFCGLAQARGDAAIVISADGQDPPEEIPRLVAAWVKGAQVVWAEREIADRASTFDDVMGRFFHRALKWLSGIENLPLRGSDFFLISRPVIEAVNGVAERNTNVMTLLAWIGFDQTIVSYKKQERGAGHTGWTLRKKLKILGDSVFGFSLAPIRAFSALGILTSLLALMYACFVIFKAVFVGRPVEGWASLMVVILLTSGIQLIMLGVLGEYQWRALDESRRRPRVVIERRTEDDGKS